MMEHATTGDGVLTGAAPDEPDGATGQTLAELAAVMTRLPQVLVNVPGVGQGAGPTPTRG